MHSIPAIVRFGKSAQLLLVTAVVLVVAGVVVVDDDDDDGDDVCCCCADNECDEGDLAVVDELESVDIDRLLLTTLPPDSLIFKSSCECC